MSKAYYGQRIALLTQHGKEQYIGAVLAPLSCTVERVDGFDTDTLGTFTGDTPRAGSQLEAARRKARIGMNLSGLQLGLGSEGSFVLDPYAGMFPWNIELLVLIDDRLGIEVVGTAQGAGCSAHIRTDDWGILEAFAQREGFPEHHIVLRPQDAENYKLHKGIADWVTLRHYFDVCRSEAKDGHVFAETDLRAFANPTRMRQIEHAAADLLRRLQSPCPSCAKPGYWVVERQPGLPCEDCRLPTQTYLAEVLECPSCKYRELHTRTDKLFAEPRHCAYCNP